MSNIERETVERVAARLYGEGWEHVKPAMADEWRERVRSVLDAADYAGAVEERDALQKLVNLYREYGSPDLTRLVNHEAKRTPPLGGQ